MYNIAKVAKGEVLIYFNDIFDALCKVRWQQQYAIGMHADAWYSLRRIRNYR